MDPWGDGEEDNYSATTLTDNSSVSSSNKFLFKELRFPERRDNYRFPTLLNSGPSGSVVKNLPARQEMRERCEFDPWVGKVPWRRKWQPTPVFLLEELHGQKSLTGYSSMGLQNKI